MSYTVVKTIRGRRYLYEQRTWREAGRVRTQSRCLGSLDPPLRKSKRLIQRIGELIVANRATEQERVAAVVAREAERVASSQREAFGETAEERAARERCDALERLHALYGLRVGHSGESSQRMDATASRSQHADANTEQALSSEQVVSGARGEE